jgi:hypothetical protein
MHIRMSFSNALLAILLMSVEPQAPRLPLAPLNEGSTRERAVQFAQAYTSICRGTDATMASVKARAHARGFTPAPNRTITGSSGFSGGTFVREALLLHPDRDPTRAPLLALSMLERRNKEGTVFEWTCELLLPATAFEVPVAEARKIFEVVRKILGHPRWQLETVDTQLGRISGSGIVIGAFEETYAASTGLHRLVRSPVPERGSVTIPR